MAKYRFADRVREVLEEQGAVFDEHGNVAIQAENTTVVAGGEPEEQPQHTTPPTDTSIGEAPQDERDRLLELQRKELENLRAEKEKWTQNQSQPEKSQREIDLENELNELRSQISEQTKQEQADAIREMLNKQGFDSEFVDDDVLIDIRDRFVKPMADKISTLEQQIAKYGDKLRDPTPEEVLEKTKATTLSKVKQEIPDFDTIFNSSEFAVYLSKQDPTVPTGTIGSAMQVAYENGNHEFIVAKINAFLGNNKDPGLAGIADVGATSGVGNTAETPKSDGFTYSNEEARKMLDMRRMRQISGQEYSEYVAKRDEFLRSNQQQ